MSVLPDHWADLIDWTHEQHWSGESKDSRDEAARDREAGLTTLALQVARWAPVPSEPDPRGKAVKGFKLTLYELPGRGDQQAQNVKLGAFALRLAPPKAAGQALVISKATWSESSWNAEAFPRTGKNKAPRYDEQRDNADLVLYLGGTRFYLRVRDPLRELDQRYEIGFRLEDGAGNAVEALDPEAAFVPKVRWRDWVARMRRIPGRFDGPHRAPQVPNDQVEARLEDETLRLIERKRQDPSVEVDVDGLRIERFLPAGKTRPQWVSQLIAESPYLKDAGAAPGAQWKENDIRKAYFIVHDVGVEGRVTEERFFPPDHPGVQFDKDTGAPVAVHGFVTWGGRYAASWDFEESKKGTVFEFSNKSARLIEHYTISIETTPVYEEIAGAGQEDHYLRPADHAAEEARVRAENEKRKQKRKKPRAEWNIGAQEFVCIGHKDKFVKVRKKQVGYTRLYKWTRSAIECLADLYLVASARAGHLLTVTAHLEMDQSLCWSTAYPEAETGTRHYLTEGQPGHGTPLALASAKQRPFFTKADFKAGKGAQIRDNPGDMHNDPQGLDMQVLYDTISARLSAAGGFAMPAGVRYGVHPRRVSEAPKPGSSPPLVRAVGNKTYRLNTFPHQSFPGWHELDASDPQEKAFRAQIQRWTKNKEWFNK